MPLWFGLQGQVSTVGGGGRGSRCCVAAMGRASPWPSGNSSSCGSWLGPSELQLLPPPAVCPDVSWQPGLASACAHPQEAAQGWGCPCASAARLLAGWAVPGRRCRSLPMWAAAFAGLTLPVAMVWCPSSFAKGQLHTSGCPVAAALVREGRKLHCCSEYVLFRKLSWIDWVNSSFFSFLWPERHVSELKFRFSKPLGRNHL